MSRDEIDIEGFSLTCFKRITSNASPVRIYIEGDGLAWMSRTQPSPDPTPRHPIGLSLALTDTSPNVVYLARPCQYSLAHSPRCEVSLWTDKRFSEEVVRVMNDALNRIMLAAPGQPIELVGYSGGAAIAVLLAARRHDVVNLRTVAGNLDHESVNRYHGVSEMPDALNPINFSKLIGRLPQRHFVGGKDTVVLPSVVEGFLAQQHDTCGHISYIPDASHLDGWIGRWVDLLSISVACP